MATEATVLKLMGQALWKLRATTSDLEAQQLAVALGYPTGWRVVRSIVDGNVIEDRIYAGDPSEGVDMWFHHAAARQAASSWDPEESTPYSFKGGHLLPRQALFDKGDKVEVLYKGNWYDAKILRRKEHPEGFRYQVYYPVDNSKQSGVLESLIRHRNEKDPHTTAVSLGLTDGWQAFSTGKNKWKIIAPSGDIYTSKKAALEAMESEPVTEVGDPPWRTSGHEYIGRYIIWETTHNVSARRKVTVQQVGQVVGWIKETDVDQRGEPGFVSEKTGQPAKLFHIKFRDDNHHPYASYLVESQDLEEFELEECLIAEDDIPPQKRPKIQ